MTSPRITPSAMAAPPTQLQAVVITGVDVVGGTAAGMTPQKSQAVINIKHYVGAVHVTPCVGEQWMVRRIGTVWVLDRKLPAPTTALLNVQANPVQGMTQLGSSGVGSGPTLLTGSIVTVLAPLQLEADTTADPTLTPGALVYDPDGDTPAVSDGLEWRPLARVSDFVVREVPAGIVNASNKTFTLANVPLGGSEMVFVNGLLQSTPAQYALSGEVITFVTAPATSAVILVSYQKQ